MTTEDAGRAETPGPGPIAGPADAAALTVRVAASPELSAADLAQLLDLFLICWPDADEFTADDIAHATGGRHWIAQAGGRIVGHLAVVPRGLETGGHAIPTGYVEAVATHTAWRGRGIATDLLRRAAGHIDSTYQLGALATGLYALYERLGWERWRGPTSVRAAEGLRRTPEDDDALMVLRTRRTPPLDLDAPISCEWRDGDAW